MLLFHASERLPHVYGTGFGSRLSTAHTFWWRSAFPFHSGAWEANRLAASTEPRAGDQPPHCLICKYKSDLFGHANREPGITHEQSQKHLQLSTAWGKMAARGSVCSALLRGTSLSQLMTVSPANAGTTGEENAPSLSIKLLDVLTHQFLGALTRPQNCKAVLK